MAAKLTARTVENARPGAKRQEIPDGQLPGLYLVVQPSGVKSWAARYRCNGKTKKHTIGRYPAVTLSEARDAARAAFDLVDRGVDPGNRSRSRGNTAPGQTIGQLVEEFDKRHLSTLKSGAAARQFLDRFLVAQYGEMKIEQFGKRDMLALLDDIVDRGTGPTANRVLAHSRKFFNWCVERDVIGSSPVAGVKAPVREKSRDRVLTDDEIKALLRVCDEIGPPYGALAKVLLLTGQRLGEVAGMRTDEIQGDTWHLPAQRTKNARAHVVPLSGPVRDILAATRPQGSQYFFTTTGEGPVNGWHKPIQRLRAPMPDGTPHWGFHDLRRTAATGMARAGVPIHVIEAVLNHVSGSISGVAGIYNRHAYETEKREALEAWAAHVGEITRG